MIGFFGFETKADREWRKKGINQEIEAGKAVVFDEDKTKFQPYRMLIDGDRYNELASGYRLFFKQPTKDASRKDPLLVWSPSKRFCYANRILPKYASLETVQGNRHGSVTFSTDIIIPTLYENIEHHIALDVWMSITPMEIFTQRQAVRMATGTVMIGGLGLGWLLSRVANKKSVKRIIVVEREQEIIDWYGKFLCQKISSTSGKQIDLVHGDAWAKVGAYGHDVRHLMDVWMSYPNCLNQEQRKIARLVKHFWGWGISRSEYEA